MLIVAGISLKNLEPRVWDRESEFWLPDLRAVMVSYGEFHQMPVRRARAMKLGLHEYIGVPPDVRVFLDNGSFFFLRSGGRHDFARYEEFVREARPDWWPVPRDFIPIPQMSARAQRKCYERTMRVNRRYEEDGFTPVVHIGAHLPRYLRSVTQNAALKAKRSFALGGIVPNLLRGPRALAYSDVLGGLRRARRRLASKHLHVFGIGGTATLHLASVFRIDSIDSSGWRNRAARGIIQLPGSGDRVIANLGSWRGREPNREELRKLRACECPACYRGGSRALKMSGVGGFASRATHNLWVLLQEAAWLDEIHKLGNYTSTFRDRLDNSTYLPLIEHALRLMEA